MISTRIVLALVCVVAAASCVTAAAPLDAEVGAYWPKGHAYHNEKTMAASDPWDYNRAGSVGPQYWPTLFPAFCDGQNQSPIDIETPTVTYDSTLSNLQFNYLSANRTVVNNGHAIQINENGSPTVQTSTVTGGGLGSMVYSLTQFHIHLIGEHTVNGKSSVMEMHLVNNNVNPADVTPAGPDTTAVIGILFQEGSHNTALDPLIAAITGEGSFATVNSMTTVVINPASFLPDDPTYYTYHGSLTTPTCAETVTWHVMTQVMELDSTQLGVLRANMPQQYTNRPTQALNGRSVSTNSAASQAGSQSLSGSTTVSSPQQTININFANLLAGFNP